MLSYLWHAGVVIASLWGAGNFQTATDEPNPALTHEMVKHFASPATLKKGEIERVGIDFNGPPPFLTKVTRGSVDTPIPMRRTTEPMSCPAGGKATAKSVMKAEASQEPPVNLPLPSSFGSNALPYRVKAPDILLIESKRLPSKVSGMQQIKGEHLVRPDGTISLGMYGSVQVEGMTLGQIKCVVENHLSPYMAEPQISVDVSAYNSRKVYLVLNSAGQSPQVVAMPAIPSLTAIEAIGQLEPLPPNLSSMKMWIARPTAGKVGSTIIPLNWKEITQSARCDANHLLQPGDRIYLQAEGAKADRACLTIDDVVNMSKRGISQKIILRQIELTNPIFDLTADDIIHLHDNGVNEDILSAMQERRR